MITYKYLFPTSIVLTLNLVANAHTFAAANLSGAEYFIDPTPWLPTAASNYTCDNDPGTSKVTSLSPSDGVWDAITETVQLSNISTAALTAGTHAVCVRFKNATGAWGPVTAARFTTGGNTNVTGTLAACEYYFDTDPGAGAGQILSAFDGSFNSNAESLNITIVIPTTLAVGTHTFYARCRDNFNRWGSVAQANFNIIDLKCTTQAATDVTETSVKLNGTVTSGSATATASFELGTTIAYGTSIIATPAQVYSATPVAISANKTGLTCATEYHFRCKAVNNAGISYNGIDQTFTTNLCHIDGVCGADNGQNLLATPTNLCSVGTSSAVTGTGPWTWTCAGMYGGATANCAANFGYATTYTVTPSANPASGGTITPSAAQVVAENATPSFTVTANSGYTKNTAVTGTCSQGSWNGNIWTTGAIVGNCTVNFGFTPEPVNAYLNPPTPIVLRDQPLVLNVLANSSTMKINSYQFVLTIETAKLAFNNLYQNASNNCYQGVCPGVNALTNMTIDDTNVANGKLTITGQDTQGGKGPGNDLQLLELHLKTKTTEGTTPVTLVVNKLANPTGGNIGTSARSAVVKVSHGKCGDSDGNNVVNIVDALAIARKVVGLNPPPTVDTILADVDQNGTVSITDALYIARYSVGLTVVTGGCTIGLPL